MVKFEHRSAMCMVNVVSSVVNFVSLKRVAGKFNQLFHDLDKFNSNNKLYLEKSDCVEKGNVSKRLKLKLEIYIYSDFDSSILSLQIILHKHSHQPHPIKTETVKPFIPWYSSVAWGVYSSWANPHPPPNQNYHELDKMEILNFTSLWKLNIKRAI